jgi:chromosome segregation ATPase
MKARWMIASLPLLAAACAASHAEQVRDARMQRVEDQEAAANNKVEQREGARKDALDQQYQAREDAVKAENSPGADQSAKLLDLSKERSEYQSEKRTQLDKLSVRIQAAQQKISVLGTRAPTKLRTELQTTQTEHQSLQQELGALGQVQSSAWEGQKSRLNERLSGLDSRVDKLSSDIDDAAD